MCGIYGIIQLDGTPANGQLLLSMGRVTLHRGPDDEGIYADGPCAIGMRRLSIIDLSGGHQPISSEDGRVWLVCNGEIYNFWELRKDCESAGDVFKSRSDTEVILALYRRHGIDCLKFLRGMFAFAIWDEQRQQLFLARDRVGKKPLNYAITQTGLAFCSELHPLSRHPGVDNGMDLEALELYLQCQFIPAPWTIYRGIRKLPAGHYMICSREQVVTRQFWQLSYTAARRSEDECAAAIYGATRQAVQRQLISDVPLGAFLSGGLDSSSIVQLMSEVTGAPVNTYSIGFSGADRFYNELPDAARMASRCRTNHHRALPRLHVFIRKFFPPRDRCARCLSARHR